jgi:hypothetical protein
LLLAVDIAPMGDYYIVEQAVGIAFFWALISDLYLPAPGVSYSRLSYVRPTHGLSLSFLVGILLPLGPPLGK